MIKIIVKLYLKKQLYKLRMKEWTPILYHLNKFNKVVNDLKYLDVKLEENQTLLFLFSLPGSYDVC